MRDVVNSTATETGTLTVPSGGTNSNTWSRQIRRSQRSDVVKTEPNAAGEFHAVTAYEAFFATLSSKKGKVRWDNRISGEHSYEWTGAEVPASRWRHGCNAQLRPEVPSSVVAQCRASMYNQALNGIDMSELVAEAGKTVSALGSILGEVGALLSAFRHGRWDQYLNHTMKRLKREGRGSAAARAYLAWIYGFQPVINDTVRICRDWDDALNTPRSKRITASVEDSSFRPPDVYHYESANGSFRRGISSAATVIVLDPGRYSASKFGLTKPLSVTWELTTLSFVVDWFLNIGQFLRTFEGVAGIGYTDYWETQWVETRWLYTRDRFKETYQSRFTTPIPPANYQVMECMVNLTCMSRITPPFLLPAPLYLKWGVDSVSKTASLLALFISRVRYVFRDDAAMKKLLDTRIRGII